MGKTDFNFGHNEEPTLFDMVTKKQKDDAPEVQIPLLNIEENWKEHYKGMPSFKQEDQMPYKTVMVHFADRNDMIAFAKLVKQKIELSTKYIWYPESEIQVRDQQWVSTEKTCGLKNGPDECMDCPNSGCLSDIEVIDES